MKSLKILACCCLLLVACTSERAKIAKKPVIKVNNTVLSAQSFADQLAQQLKNFDALAAKDPRTVKRAKDAITQNFIVEVITENWAQQQGLFVRKEALDAEINSVRSHYPNDLAFRRALAEENLNFEDWKRKVKSTLLQKLVFKKLAAGVNPPTEQELKDYYEAHKDEFQVKEQVKLRQAVLENEANAKIVLDELRRGKKLSELAKKFSVAPEGPSGGELGWVEKGSLEIFDEAFKLRSGQRTEVLKSPYGYHIIEVLDKRSGKTMAFNEVKDRILRSLLEKREQAAYSAWLETQIRKAQIFRDETLLSQIQVQTRGS